VDRIVNNNNLWQRRKKGLHTAHLETFIIQIVDENLPPFPLLSLFAPLMVVMLVSDGKRRYEKVT
jgi:hypothetical protein